MNITLAESLFILHLNKLPAIEATEILTVIDISELVAENARIADGCIYVGLQVSQNPRINTAVGNKVAQLRREGTIQ